MVHALLLPYSAAFAVSAQCELVALLCTFAVFACGFFSEGLAAGEADDGGALVDPKSTGGVQCCCC